MKLIKSIICCLFTAKFAFAQLTVFPKPDHVIPDGIDTKGGIALTVAGGTTPYTYTWNPGAINTSGITNVNAGQYTVNVRSANSLTRTAVYNLGYKLQWTNLFRTTFRNDSLISNITGTTYGSAASFNTLPPNTDGWFEFVVNDLYSSSKKYFIGFTDSISTLPNTTADIDYGIYFDGGNKYTYAAESGTNTVLTTTTSIYDVINVSRVGNTITYKINNTTVRTYSATGIAQKTLKLEANLAIGVTMLNVGCSFSNISNNTFAGFEEYIPYVKHSSGVNINDASVFVKNRYRASQSCTFQPGPLITNTLSSITASDYTVTIADSIQNKSYGKVSVGYKTSWINLQTAELRNDTLIGTGANGGVYGYGRTYNYLPANTDGWFEFVLPEPQTYNYTIGFADSSANNSTTTTDIQFGFNYLGSSKLFYAYESGTQRLVYSGPRAGDVMRVERVGNAINYKINGITVQTTTNTAIGAKVFRVKDRMAGPSMLVNIGCSFRKDPLEIRVAKSHITLENNSSGVLGFGAVRGKPSYTVGCVGYPANQSVMTNLTPGNYQLYAKDANNDSVATQVMLGLQDNWTIQHNVSFIDNSYTNTRPTGDSAAALVASNMVIANKNGWHEITIGSPAQNFAFGFLGFTGGDLASGYTVPQVKETSVNTVLKYADSLLYNRFAVGAPKQVSPAFGQLHLVSFANGQVSIGFKSYSPTVTVTYKEGDVFRMQRSGNYIALYKNNTLVTTETVSSSSQYLLNAMFIKSGTATILAPGGYADSIPPANLAGHRTGYCADDNLNWVHSVTYDENGVVKSESRQYMDLLGRPLQTQSRLISEANILAVEPIYDGFGRAVGQTLPAPLYRNYFCYDPYFFEAASSVPYSAAYFDNAPGTAAPGMYNSANGVNQQGDVNNPVPVYQGAIGQLGWYYSNNNTNDNLVANDAFPYTRVDYYNDPLGRVKRSAGVGQYHRMGTGHESKLIYTSTPDISSDPTQNELNFVFPYRTYELEKDFSVNTSSQGLINRNLQLFKTISLNADGKDQITYTNSAGKVIATCITGDGTGCVSHTQIKQLYNNTAGVVKNFQRIYIPKNKATTFKYYQQTGTANSYNHVVPVLRDAFTGIALVPGTDYTYNSSTGAVTFMGNYAGKSLYLEAGYNLSPSNYSIPANTTINTSYDTDYSQWTLYFYDRKGRLLGNASPNDVACQTTPYSLQKIAATNNFLNTSQLYQPNVQGRMIYNRPAGLSFALNSTAVSASNKEAYVSLSFRTDTITTLVPNTSLFALFSRNAEYPVDSAYAATHPYSKTWADTTITIPVDTNMAHANIYDSIAGGVVNVFGNARNRYYGHIDSVCRNSLKYALVGQKIHYNGFFRFKAQLSNSTTVNLPVDSLPFNFEVEALAYDSASGGVVCRVNGYGNNTVHKMPLPHLPDNTTSVFIEAEIAVSNVMPSLNLYGADGTGGVKDPPTANNPGGTLLVGATHIDGNLQINQYNPTPIPVNLANRYFWDKYDRLIGSQSDDEGRVDYVYDNKEDKLLFTQNDKQRANGGKFNCVVYDPLGRVTATGEYNPSLSGTGNAYYFLTYTDITANVSAPVGRTSISGPVNNNLTQVYDDGRISDVTRMQYDAPDNNLPVALNNPTFRQRYTSARVTKSWNSNTTSWYNYDELGRMVQSVQNSSGLGYKTMQYVYDLRGKLIISAYQANKTDAFYHLYSYDADERLVQAKSGTNLFAVTPLARYGYYSHGPLKRTVLGNNLQGLDYVYTISGALKSINNPVSTSTALDPGQDGYSLGPNAAVKPDAFKLMLQYYNGDYSRGSSPIQSYNYTSAYGGTNLSYAGLIKNVSWYTQQPPAQSGNPNYTYMYEYNYNELYELSGAQFGTVSGVSGNAFTFGLQPQYKLDNITYDKNGNLQTLRRYAEANGSGGAHLLDDLTYNYSSTLKNRLLKVADASANTGGYSTTVDLPNQTNSNNYVYNEIGELTQNKQENYGYDYNAAGLVTRVYKLNNNMNIASFTYNDKGLRHSKTLYTGNFGLPLKVIYYSYDGSGALLATYTQDITDDFPPVQVQDYALYGLGRVGLYDVASGKNQYELNDHLGNTRAVVVANSSGNAEVISYTDYYPHGGAIPGRTYVNGTAYRYGYQGQEKDAEVNLTNFELRQYDARLGRWQCPDPYGEFHSPYLAMGNNPVSTIDATGGYTSDQFWGSSEAPDVGEFKGHNFTPEDRSSESPAPEGMDRSWITMTPAQRRLALVGNGKSYEQQDMNRFLDLVFLGGYEDIDGSIWTYSPRKNDIGTWQKILEDKPFHQHRIGTEDGSLAGGFRFINAIEKWCGLGLNGQEKRMLWAQRTYGGSGDGSFLDQLHYSFSSFNTKWNPIAHLVDAMNGVYSGTDRFGNKQSGLETTTKAASGIVFIFGGAISDAIVARATLPQTFEEIAMNPGILWGKSQNEVADMLGDGWKVGTYGSNKMGWKFFKGDKSVFYNASSSAHGGAQYYGFSSTFAGKVKIVDPNTYLPRFGDKATIFYRPISPFN